MPGASLVGRDVEVGILRQAVEAVRSGQRRFVVLSGEAGIGKTRLLGVVEDVAKDRGFEVLRGHATELESDVPFAAVLEAFGPRVGQLSSMLDPTAGEGITPATRWRLYRAITDQLDALSDPDPVALIVDDVHWADPVTLELLEHFIRRPARRAHLVVLGLRPGRVAQRLLDAQRATGGPPAEVNLRPLELADAVKLMPATSDADDRARIFTESGGNPMLIQELARADPATTIPGGISAFVSVELGRLPSPALRLLCAGAVLGDPFDIDLARRVSGLGRDESTSAVDDLVERALLRTTTETRMFAFRHPVVRTAVYASMPSGRRLAGHARAAQVLTAVNAPTAARARHLAISAAPGDVDAARLLRKAAAIVRPQAPGIAADWLIAAERAEPADAELLAETLVDAGRLAQALATAEQALAVEASDDTPDADRRTRLTLVAASVERLIGRHEAALRRLTRAVDEGLASGPTAGRLLANLALSAYESGRYDEIGPLAVRARAAAGADRVVHAVTASLLAMGHAFAGSTTLARAETQLAITSLASAADQELATQAELLGAVSWSLLALERLPESLAIGRRAATAAGRAGNSSAAVTHQLAMVLALGLLGRLREGVDAADLAEQAARVTGNDQAVQWALWIRGWMLLERGDVQTARTASAESVSLAARLDDSSLAVVARAVHGAALVAAGEPAAGRPMIAAYALDPGWVCRWAPRLVEADLALGDDAAAREHADRATALARVIGLAGPRAAAARTQAMVALAAGELTLAADLAINAITDARSVGAELEVARSELMVGRALGTMDRKTAIGHLERARLLADECGAQRVQDQAVRELRRLGRRVGRGGPRASGDGSTLGALSPREREVAGFVAAGLTNKEIAARLFLSEKTVESHLSRTFSKLDVRSRAALAARLGTASPAQTDSGTPDPSRR